MKTVHNCIKRLLLIAIAVIFLCFILPNDSFASSNKISDYKIKLSVAKKEVNGTSCQVKTYNKVRITWNKIPGAVKYRVYKYNSSKEKYETYKTIKGSSKNKLSVTGLRASTKYKFKVRAFDSSGKYITSKAFSVTTKGKTDGYFADRIIWKSVWSGIKYTSSKASDSSMASYKINGVKSPIKYNYSCNVDTLYIHVYAKFEGAGKSNKFGFYEKNDKGKYTKAGTSRSSYASVAKKGIVEKWSKSVTGDKYDFIKGCNFKTSVIFHTSGLDSDQKYVRFLIGDEKCKQGSDNIYWFFTKGYNMYKISDKKILYNYNNEICGQMTIYLPTNEQLLENKHKEGYINDIPKTIDCYKSTAAHEFGHILGLADAYDGEENNGKTIKRINKTAEVGYYKNDTYFSLMMGAGFDKNVKVMDNDIEMALQAQGEAIQGKGYSLQAYKDYTINGIKYQKSSVIRK